MGCTAPIENNAIHIEECIAGPLTARWVIWDEENSREGHSDYPIKLECAFNRTELDLSEGEHGGQFVVRSQFTSGGAESARLTTQAGACFFLPYGWFPYLRRRTTKNLPVADPNNVYVHPANTRSHTRTDSAGTTWNLAWVLICGYAKILVVGDPENVGYNGPITINPCTPLTWNTVVKDNMAANFNTVIDGTPCNGDMYPAVAMGEPVLISDKSGPQLILAWCFADNIHKYNDGATQGTGWSLGSAFWGQEPR